MSFVDDDDGKLFFLNAPNLGVSGCLFDDMDDFVFSLKSPFYLDLSFRSCC